MQIQIPEFKEQLQHLQIGMGILDAIVKGIEQAGRELEMQNRLQERQRVKVKKTKKHMGYGTRTIMKSHYRIQVVAKLF